MNFTDEQIEQAFDSLPETTQDMLFTPEIEGKIQKIGIEVGLLSAQLKTLSSGTNFAIMGLLSEQEFEAEIKKSFSFSDTQTKDLVQKISTEILAPRNELRLKALAEQKDGEEKEKWEALEDEAAKQSIPETEQEVRETPAERTGEGAPSEYSSEAPVVVPATVVSTEASAKILSQQNLSGQAHVWKKAPDVVPHNLPTEEATASFLFNLPPKTVSPLPDMPDNGVHPFEQKMKQVFTASVAENEKAVLEMPSHSLPETLPEQKPDVETPPPPVSDPRSADPYREPI
jgi:hypothetical protein